VEGSLFVVFVDGSVRESRLVRCFGEAMALDWDAILVLEIWSRRSNCLFRLVGRLLLVCLRARS